MARTRKRRRAEDAREAILTAAERRLMADGPAALRLQELAAEVGISHPAILHHFGCREGLVKAVVERAVRKLQGELVQAFTANGPPSGVTLLDRVYETLATRGHARLMAWLLLSGYEPLDGTEVRAQWRNIIDVTHAARTLASTGRTPPREDTAFTVVLSALAILGQALAGPSAFQAAGLGRGRRAQARFRGWLAGLLTGHLEAGPSHSTVARLLRRP
jgi:AcrR family transcriptional regulator